MADKTVYSKFFQKMKYMCEWGEGALIGSVSSYCCYNYNIVPVFYF